MSTESPDRSPKSPTAAEVADGLAKLGGLVNGRRGRISEDGAKSVALWVLLVLSGALIDEFQSLDAAAQKSLIDLVWSKLLPVLSLPGARLAYEAWRKDQ